jgi:hypothetical protein
VDGDRPRRGVDDESEPAAGRRRSRRTAGPKQWGGAVGDGGPPVGIDLLALILAALAILSMALWWRSAAPVAGCYLLPLLGSVLVVYFFWQGRNWARFLLLTGALVEIAGSIMLFALWRSYVTAPEMLVCVARLAMDVYLIAFCVRPDTVAYFEKKSGRPARR